MVIRSESTRGNGGGKRAKKEVQAGRSRYVETGLRDGSLGEYVITDDLESYLRKKNPEWAEKKPVSNALTIARKAGFIQIVGKVGRKGKFRNMLFGKGAPDAGAENEATPRRNQLDHELVARVIHASIEDLEAYELELLALVAEIGNSDPITPGVGRACNALRALRSLRM